MVAFLTPAEVRRSLCICSDCPNASRLSNTSIGRGHCSQTAASATIARVRRDLLLLRHAKSAWDDPSLADHDRPLAPRGTKALRRLADYLTRAEYRPDVVLCSSARRTVETLDGIRSALPKRASVEIADELYGAHANTLLRRLHGLNDE